MACNFCNYLLRTFYLIFSTIAKPRLKRLLLAFYFVVLFLSKDYLLIVLRASYGFLPSGTHQPLKQQPQRELIQIQVVFKHGHRAPFRIYPTDPYPKELWAEGLGQVTKLGRLQLYVVGDHLRKRYSNLISSNPNEIEIQSSDAARSIFSAYSFLAGMYPPDEEWEFVKNLKWQPIPVNYVPEEIEKYLQSNPNCPKYEEAKHRVAKSNEVQTFIQKHKPFYDFVRNKSGNEHCGTYDCAGDVYKTLSVERDSNFTIPDWGIERWEDFIYHTDMGYYFHFMSKTQQRLRAGPILGLILERMQERMEKEISHHKVYAYSGHGSNIAAIQCALLVYDMKHAPHAATIVFELYREAYGNHTVRFVYFNSTNPERKWEKPLVFKLPGCPEFCPMETFEDFLKDLVPENWKKECEERDNPEQDFVPLQLAEVVWHHEEARSTAMTIQRINWMLNIVLLIILTFVVHK